MSDQSIAQIKNIFSSVPKKLSVSAWSLDANHHSCVAADDTINKCSAAIAHACSDAAEEDPAYLCPTPAFAFNLDRFARACHLDVAKITTSVGVEIDLVAGGVPDPAIGAAFSCVCTECLSSAYPGCQWLSGTLDYAECRRNLDCYAGNAGLNIWTTLTRGEISCWNVYYYVGIVAAALLVLLVIYGFFARRSSNVRVEQRVVFDGSAKSRFP